MFPVAQSTYKNNSKANNEKVWAVVSRQVISEQLQAHQLTDISTTIEVGSFGTLHC